MHDTFCRYDPEVFNPLNAELNPTCHMLEVLGAHHILHVSRIRVKLKFRKNKFTITRGTPTATLSIVSCLNHLSSASRTSLRSGFRKRFILYQLRSNAPIILFLYFTNALDRVFYQTKFATHARLPFSHFLFVV